MSRALSLNLFAATSALLVGLIPASVLAQKQTVAKTAEAGLDQKFVREFCIDCHDGSEPATSFRMDRLIGAGVEQNAESWEKVVRKLELREMPPTGSARPSEQRYNSAIADLSKSLDATVAAKPNPGRTETFRRLTRSEYQNAVRDLLGLEIDVSDLLPADESSRGFDNITVANLSPTLLTRYIAAAQKIGRLATGVVNGPIARTYRIRPDVTQDVHVDGLPYGKRGGLLIPHVFPQEGDYSVETR